MRPVRRHSERGYALVFVFALAAVMAMQLYMELPRLALQMQRNREEILIQRGEEYTRAIKLFARKNKKLPQRIEDLENTNGVRFLRRRYTDPITGKDEWRLIHADNSGRLTDSLVQKAPAAGEIAGSSTPSASSVSAGPVTGATEDPNAPARVAQALNRRASEMPGAAGAPPPPGSPTAPATDPNNPETTDPSQQSATGQPGPQNPQQPMIGPNGMPIQRIPGLPGPFGQQGQPGAAANAANGQNPAGNANPSTGYTIGSGYVIGSGYSVGSGTGTATSTPNASTASPQPMRPAIPGMGSGMISAQPPGSGSTSLPGGSPPGVNVNPAAQLIQQILTRPNPQGLANLQAAGAQGGLGAGIIGVASTADAEGIKVYNERTNYKEWEFVYDPTKDQKGATQTPSPSAPKPAGSKP